MSSAMRTMLLVECAGGCGVLVRPEAEHQLCDACLGLNQLLEDRYKRERSARPVEPLIGESARHQMGVVVFDRHHPEMDNGGEDAASVLASLDRAEWREKLLGTLLLCGLALGAGSLGLGVWWIARHVLGHFVRP